MTINRIYETQNLLSLHLVSLLVGLRTYRHPCNITAVVLKYFVQTPHFKFGFENTLPSLYWG